MKGRVLIGAGVAVIAVLVGVGYAGYSAMNRPWWDDGRELERVFAGPRLQLEVSSSGRGGNLLCFDECPSLTAGLASQPNNFETFTAALTTALDSHGYVLSDDFRALDASGRVVTAPFECVAPNQLEGSVRYWTCQFNARGGRYRMYGSFEASPDTPPQHVYNQAGMQVADSLPAETPLVHVTVTVIRN